MEKKKKKQISLVTYITWVWEFWIFDLGIFVFSEGGGGGVGTIKLPNVIYESVII